MEQPSTAPERQLRLKVATDVRIRLGEWGRGQNVSVDRIAERRSWTLSQDLAAVLILFMGGRGYDDGIDAASEILQISPEKAAGAIEMLTRRSLLKRDDMTDEAVGPDRDTWTAKGWTAAYDHHLATWDYPFVDYDDDGWQEDRRRMAAYNEQEADAGVWKHDACERLTPTVPLTPAMSALLRLDATTTPVTGPLNMDSLSMILSATFGRLPSHPGSRKPRRSSPSGGARHPTEGYLLNLAVDGLRPGIWHVRGRDHDLAWIGGLPDHEWLAKNLSGLFLSNWPPEALVVVTSVFGRNMYRYREPRTLRTIFMDAGHVIGTLEMVAAQIGARSFVHHALDDRAVEQLLNLTGLREGVIAGVGLAGAA
jgi:SagB-type dehydrogenase family enzyme